MVWKGKVRAMVAGIMVIVMVLCLPVQAGVSVSAEEAETDLAEQSDSGEEAGQDAASPLDMGGGKFLRLQSLMM